MGQAVPPNAVADMSIRERAHLIDTVQSFCTAQPRWEMTMNDHWCRLYWQALPPSGEKG